MIKNIIFDVDGVLVDCDKCYVEFLKNSYQKFKNITCNDLPIIFPISPDNGAVKLSPEFSQDFKQSPYYFYRPLFEDTMNVLISLKKKGFKLFTLSAARNPEKKLKWISATFKNIFESYEFSPSGKSKDEALRGLLKKYSLNQNETMFVEDRFQNIRAGINAGIYTVRMEPKNSLPLPEELKHINVVRSMTEFENFVEKFNTKGNRQFSTFIGVHR